MTKADNLAAIWKQYEDWLEFSDTDNSWRSLYSSGVLALDLALGNINGIPQGLMQIIGDEAHGKTTLAYTFLANAQRQGLKDVTLPNGKVINALFLDFERTYDPTYAKTIGVDIDKVLKVVTPYAEQSFDITTELLNAGLQFVIIDSISTIIPKSEEDKTMMDNVKMASEASVISRGLKRINQLAYNADAFVIIINQWRANMSPMAQTEKKPYGVRILKHIVKYTIELARIERKDTRMTIQAFVSKTKAGAIGRKIQYDIDHGNGIDIPRHIISLAVDHGIVEKAGAWFYYPSKSDPKYKAQGENNASTILPVAEIKSKLIQELA